MSHFSDADVSLADPALLQEYQGAFDKVDAHIESFILSLPSLASLTSSPSTPPELIRSLAVTHALARVAVVQLHTPWVDESMRSAAKSISACKAIMAAIRSVPASRLGTVDPLILVSCLLSLFRILYAFPFPFAFTFPFYIVV